MRVHLALRRARGRGQRDRRPPADARAGAALPAAGRPRQRRRLVEPGARPRRVRGPPRRAGRRATWRRARARCRPSWTARWTTASRPASSPGRAARSRPARRRPTTRGPRPSAAPCATRLGRDAPLAGVPWGADMRLFTARGIPAVMVGTTGIERAHAVDESRRARRARDGRADDHPRRAALAAARDDRSPQLGRRQRASRAHAAAARRRGARDGARAARPEAAVRRRRPRPARPRPPRRPRSRRARPGRQPRVGLGHRARGGRAARPARRRARTRARSPRPRAKQHARRAASRPAGSASSRWPSASARGTRHRRRTRVGAARDARVASTPPSERAEAPAAEQQARGAGVAGGVGRGRDGDLDRAEREPISTKTTASVRTPGARSAPPPPSARAPAATPATTARCANTSVPRHAAAPRTRPPRPPATTTRARPRSAPGRRCRSISSAAASSANAACDAPGEPSSAGHSVRRHAPSGGSAAPATTAQGRIAASDDAVRQRGEGDHRERAHQRAATQDRRLPAAVDAAARARGEHTALASACAPDATPAAAKEPVSSFVRSTNTSDSAVAGARPTSDATNSRAESAPAQQVQQRAQTRPALPRRGLGGVELALHDVQALVPEARVGEVDADDRAELLRRLRTRRRDSSSR